MTDNERILNRIKKMLNLANDAAATEGERDNALRMAYATLAKHNLDMASVENFSQDKTNGADEKRERITAAYNRHHWARVVSMAIAELFFCTYYYTRRRDQHVTHSFIGRTSNVVTAAAMAEYICASITREAACHSRGHFSPGAAQRDFCKGAVNRIVRRCYEMRKEVETPAPAAQPGMALVLVNFYAAEKVANDKALVAMGVQLTVRKSGARGASNWDSYKQGAAYGEKVSLDRQIGAKS